MQECWRMDLVRRTKAKCRLETWSEGEMQPCLCSQDTTVCTTNSSVPIASNACGEGRENGVKTPHDRFWLVALRWHIGLSRKEAGKPMPTFSVLGGKWSVTHNDTQSEKSPQTNCMQMLAVAGCANQWSVFISSPDRWDLFLSLTASNYPSLQVTLTWRFTCEPNASKSQNCDLNQVRLDLELSIPSLPSVQHGRRSTTL